MAKEASNHYTKEAKEKLESENSILKAVLDHALPDFDMESAAEHLYVKMDGTMVYMPPTDSASEDGGEEDEGDTVSDTAVSEDAVADSSEQQVAPSSSPSKVPARLRALKSEKAPVKESDPSKMSDKDILDWYDKQLTPSDAALVRD